VGEVHLSSVWVDYRAPRRRRHHRRSRFWALQDVDLVVGPGERLGVIGGNGSGKTTLLRTISGVFVPTAGRTSVSGRVASVVDLEPGIQRDLNGHENLQIEATLMGLDEAELARRYDDILDLAALPPDVMEQPVYTYSSGMMLRLRLALAIGCEPGVLVVDEVLAVADARFQERYLSCIADLCRSGTSVVLASHNLETIAEHTDQAVVLDAGRVVLAGPSGIAAARYQRAIAEDVAPTAASGEPGLSDPGAAMAPQGGTLAERLARTG